MVIITSKIVFAAGKMGACSIPSDPPTDGVTCQSNDKNVIVQTCAGTHCIASATAVVWVSETRCKSTTTKPVGHEKQNDFMERAYQKMESTSDTVIPKCPDVKK